jgi:hypothetical protein
MEGGADIPVSKFDRAGNAPSAARQHRGDQGPHANAALGRNRTLTQLVGNTLLSETWDTRGP